MRTVLRWAGWFSVLAVIAAGCGADQEMTSPTLTTEPFLSPFRSCEEVGGKPPELLVLCQEHGPDNHGVFLIDEGTSRTELPIGTPGPTPTAKGAARVGHWDWAALSPDGTMLLAQWSAECEVPIAFFMPADGGEPRVVSGEEDWAMSPTSVALGWTTDGRAIILFPDVSPCGSTDEPGLYLIGVDGTHERIRGVDRFAERLQPSLRPRPAASLR